MKNPLSWTHNEAAASQALDGSDLVVKPPADNLGKTLQCPFCYGVYHHVQRVSL